MLWLSITGCLPAGCFPFIIFDLGVVSFALTVVCSRMGKTSCESHTFDHDNWECPAIAESPSRSLFFSVQACNSPSSFPWSSDSWRLKVARCNTLLSSWWRRQLRGLVWPWWRRCLLLLKLSLGECGELPHSWWSYVFGDLEGMW